MCSSLLFCSGMPSPCPSWRTSCSSSSVRKRNTSSRSCSVTRWLAPRCWRPCPAQPQAEIILCTEFDVQLRFGLVDCDRPPLHSKGSGESIRKRSGGGETPLGWTREWDTARNWETKSWRECSCEMMREMRSALHLESLMCLKEWVERTKTGRRWL